MSARHFVLGLTAADDDELRRTAAAAATQLREMPETTHRDHQGEGKVRLLARAATAEEIAHGLTAFASGGRDPSVKVYARTSDPCIAFVFPGQSETRAGMGEELYRQDACFASVIDHCSATMGEELGTSLASALYDSENPGLLGDARFAQPALFALQNGLAALWEQWGVAPDIVAGHSLGEYAAACVAGVMSLDDGIRLVAARGHLTQSCALPGLMAVVFASEEWVKAALASREGDISIAAINAPGVVVVSGQAEAITALLAAADLEGVSAKALNISHPFHSCCIEPMLRGLAEVAAKTPLSAPRIPFASALEGRLLAQNEIPDASYWCRHAREPVQFLNTMRALAREGCTVFLELGPHATLTGLGERCTPPETAQWFPSLKRSGHNWHVLTETATKLWLAGVNVSLAAVARSAGWECLQPLSTQESLVPTAESPAR
jgi:acyl transferase domain-containing protein